MVEQHGKQALVADQWLVYDGPSTVVAQFSTLQDALDELRKRGHGTVRPN